MGRPGTHDAGCVVGGCCSHVEDRSECLDPSALRAALEETLLDHDAGARGPVTVVGNRAQAATIVTLRTVTVLGEIALERRFELRPKDCASATDLLAAALDRFLQDFHRAQWGEAPPESKSSPPPPPPKRVVVTQDVTGFSGLVLLGVDSRWLPATGDVKLGLAVDVGSPHHALAVSAIVRERVDRCPLPSVSEIGGCANCRWAGWGVCFSFHDAGPMKNADHSVDGFVDAPSLIP